MNIKKIGPVLFAGLVVLSAMVVFVTPVVANGAINLWVVPGDPDATRYVATDPDEILNETLISDTFMDTTFSCNVSVLNRDRNSNATDVDLKVFVRNATNIDTIEIGTAKLVNCGSMTNDDNSGQNVPTVTTFTEIAPVDVSRPFLAGGWLVVYPIGDIPMYDGYDYGNPEDDIDSFFPEQANCSISVPITINFIDPPEQGFIIYAYAENPDNKVKTVWSHDCGFYNVPEFTTIAIPVAAVLGLLFFFNHRKKRRE